MFDLFYRYYHDVTQALLGKQVYVPNLQARYDREVSILAYVNYLDVDSEREALFKKAKVHNITDFLKKRIQKDGTMKRYMETVTKQFISAETLNYKKMEVHDRIKMKLAEHGIAVEFDSKVVGSAVTLYKFEPSIGVKMTKIDGYSRDIEQAVGVAGIRILAPIPGSELVGFEVPQAIRTFPEKKPTPHGFMLDMGVDIMGKSILMDFREFPHMIVAGATGSGKSVFLNSLIYQLKDMPLEVVLMDPKRVELAEWRGIPNLKEYADDAESINVILTELVVEMNRRYDELQRLKLKNTNGTSIPTIVVILDEFGDLVVSSDYGPEIKRNILVLAQKARAAGIHLIIATQRPSTKIITGDIKSNFIVRVAFRVSSRVDSQVVLDVSGAEKLLGKGDFLLSTSSGISRLQGYNV
jgi:S-DNA-T family DNA segregation ATPase FtsK/SpoIIIE